MDFKKNPKTDFKKIDEINKQEAKKEIEALREGIEYHNYLYYIKNEPKISDSLYDKLFERLQKLEEKFPEFQSPNSPTKRVGAEPIDELKKVEHTVPLLSLDAAGNREEVEEFNRRVIKELDEDKVEYVIEPKFDGFSVEIVYENGQFKYGATRGDGVTGEDVSDNLRTIKSIPLRLQKKDGIPSMLALRGEVFMWKSGFQDLNKKRLKEGKDAFANPRNAASGLMRQKDPNQVVGKPLDIVFYEILHIEGQKISNHWEALKKFPEWGLKTSPKNKKCKTIDKIDEFHHDLEENRDELDYELDGIVVKVNDYGVREKLGTRQRNPRWAVAWKFAPRAEITTLEDIVVQVGKSGMITPVALLDPVEVGGVTVSRASLHNEDEVREKGVLPGDKVRIARAGDVIPEVVERIEKGTKKEREEFSMPKKCPSCGTKVYREGAYYFCPSGLTCRAQLIGRLKHYASREAMNIETLGDKTVRELVNRDMVEDMAGLYFLTKEDFLGLEGFAEKSARQLYDSIQESKTPRFDKFLYALGIRHVGVHVARILANQYRNLDEIMEANAGELEEVSEIGPEIAQSVTQFFKQRVNRKVLERLQEAGLNIEEMPKDKENILEGKTFVFTGELDNYTRSEAQEKIETLGGRATSTVSGNTDYVVVGESPGSKLEKAKENNVKIVDEVKFRNLIKE